MKKTLTLLLLAASLLMPALFAQETAPQANDKPLIFTLKAPGGEPTVRLQHTDNGLLDLTHKGKVVLINFFGKHCKWCMKEIPHLVDLQKKYKGQLQIIAVHAQQAMTPGERHMLEKKFHFNYPIYEYQSNPDFVNYISYRTGWRGSLPFSIIFDKKGNFVYKFEGYAPEEDLKKVIDFAIKSSGK